MATAIRNTDWSETEFGAREAWPPPLRFALETMLGIGFPAFLWWGPNHLQFRNDPASALVGSDTGSGRSRGPFWGLMGRNVERVARTGTTIVDHVVFPHSDARPGLAPTFLAFSFSAVGCEDGGAGGVLAVAQPVEDLRLRLGLDDAAHLFWTRSAETLRLRSVSPGYVRLSGIPAQGLIEVGDPVAAWSVLLAPEDRPHVLEAFKAACDGNRVVVDYRILGIDGQPRHIRDMCFPIRDASGEVVEIAGLGQDLTAARTEICALREQLAEAQHSSRNTLAIIRSIARRSTRNRRSVADYADHLDGRITALSRVQTALSRDARGVKVAALAADTLIATGARESREFNMAGPDVFLHGRQAQTFGLALHELATNAVKFGALSRDGGRIALDWGLDWLDPAAPVLDFNWTENGGAASDQRKPLRPIQKGFGIELLERTMPHELDAAVTCGLEPEGARCRIRLPLADVGRVT